MKLLDVGNKVKASRIKNLEIANDLGVSEKAVSEWMNGKKFPSDKNLNYLLSKLGELKAETDDGSIITLSSVSGTSNPTPPRLDQKKRPGKTRKPLPA